MLKPIPTEYNGTLYRSKLEARWAVFFDAIGFQVMYEPFDKLVNETSGVEYKPDFFLLQGITPERGVLSNILIEIKPREPSLQYLHFLQRFHDPGKSMILVCVGAPTLIQPHGYILRMKRDKGSPTKETELVKGFVAVRCDDCGRYELNEYDFYQSFGGYLSCERFHNPKTRSNEYAADVAQNFRFDIHSECNVWPICH